MKATRIDQTSNAHYLELARTMARQMLNAAYDAHGSLALCPPAYDAFEFCADVEAGEPGTYPLFAGVEPIVRDRAMRDTYSQYG